MRHTSLAARNLTRTETLLLGLGVCMPVPALAASGLAIPLPAVVYQLAAGLVERTEALASVLGLRHPSASDESAAATSGTIRLTRQELAGASAPSVSSSPAGARRVGGTRVGPTVRHGATTLVRPPTPHATLGPATSSTTTADESPTSAPIAPRLPTPVPTATERGGTSGGGPSLPGTPTTTDPAPTPVVPVTGTVQTTVDPVASAVDTVSATTSTVTSTVTEPTSTVVATVTGTVDQTTCSTGDLLGTCR